MATQSQFGLNFNMSPVNPDTYMYETEEERRRRLQREQMAVSTPVAPGAQAAPVTATPGADAVLQQAPVDFAGFNITQRGPNYDTLLQGSAVNPQVRDRLATDNSAPPDVRAVANEQGRRDAENEKKKLEAQQMLQSGDPNKIAAALGQRDPNGSYLSLMAYKLLGMTNLALNEERKLGAGTVTENLTSPDGKTRARITFDGFGQPRSGYDQTGRQLDPQELAAYATGRPDTAGGLPQKGEFLVDQKNRPFQQVFDPRNPQVPMLVPIGHQDQPEGQLVRSTQSANLAGQVAGGKTIGSTTAEQTGAIAPQVPVLKPPPPPPLPNTQTTQTTQAVAPPPSNTQTTQTTQTTPPITQTTQTTQPVAPPTTQTTQTTQTQTGGGGAPRLTVTQPNISPVIGGGGGGVRPPSGGVVPAGQYKAQQEINVAGAKEAIQTAETEPRENIKANTALSTEVSKKARESGTQLSTIDRVSDYTKSHPQFFGEWIGGEAYRTFREAQTETERREALNRVAQAANISTKDRPEFQKLMNDIRRLELSGITSSGLSATQLNTERESQRAVGAFAVSITDSAQAARAQAMIARAQVEYNRAFNRYLGSANKRLSPSVLQDDFDTRTGDKIFSDLDKKLKDEFPQAAGNASANTGFQVLNRRPAQ
jgi:hypothetical protein